MRCRRPPVPPPNRHKNERTYVRRWRRGGCPPRGSRPPRPAPPPPGRPVEIRCIVIVRLCARLLACQVYLYPYTQPPTWLAHTAARCRCKDGPREVGGRVAARRGGSLQRCCHRRSTSSPWYCACGFGWVGCVGLVSLKIQPASKSRRGETCRERQTTDLAVFQEADANLLQVLPLPPLLLRLVLERHVVAAARLAPVIVPVAVAVPMPVAVAVAVARAMAVHGGGVGYVSLPGSPRPRHRQPLGTLSMEGEAGVEC